MNGRRAPACVHANIVFMLFSFTFRSLYVWRFERKQQPTTTTTTSALRHSNSVHTPTAHSYAEKRDSHGLATSNVACSRFHFVSMLYRPHTPVRLNDWVATSHDSLTRTHTNTHTEAILSIFGVRLCAAATAAHFAMVCVSTQNQLWIFHLGVVSVW